MSLPSFSQTVTQSKDSQVVVLPVKVAREVVKDLMRGDSAIAQLSLANIQISQLELKVVYQDSVIQKLKSKEDNYITLIDSEKRKNEILNDEIKTTQKELRKVKTKKTFSQIISGAIILTLSYLYITK
jgi:hypothetical protein